MSSAQGRPKKTKSCHFFIDRKKRYCNMGMTPGSLYCGVHEPDPGKGKERVTCPVDKSHTVVAAYLNAHVRICNGSKDRMKNSAQPYYREGINLGAQTQTAPPSGAVIDAKALFTKVLEMVNARQQVIMPDDRIQQVTAGEVAERIMALIEQNGWGGMKRRHVIQQASLVCHLHQR